MEIGVPWWLLLITEWIGAIMTISAFSAICIKPLRVYIINKWHNAVKVPDQEQREQLRVIDDRVTNLEENDAIQKEGMKALLASDIYDKAQTYINRKEITPYQLEILETLADSYKAQGGNGTVKKLVEECEKLPTRTTNE